MASARGRLLAFLGIVALGAVRFGWLQYSGDAPKKRDAKDRGRAVRTLDVQPIEVVPRVTGYGVVQAQRTWQAVAEVGGTIVQVADNLEVGRTIEKGTQLFKIDPGSYELEQNRVEASVRGVRAQIAEIKTREESARANLKIERRVLDLATKDLERAKKALEGGLGAQTGAPKRSMRRSPASPSTWRTPPTASPSPRKPPPSPPSWQRQSGSDIYWAPPHRKRWCVRNKPTAKWSSGVCAPRSTTSTHRLRSSTAPHDCCANTPRRCRRLKSRHESRETGESFAGA